MTDADWTHVCNNCKVDRHGEQLYDDRMLKNFIWDFHIHQKHVEGREHTYGLPPKFKITRHVSDVRLFSICRLLSRSVEIVGHILDKTLLKYVGCRYLT